MGTSNLDSKILFRNKLAEQCLQFAPDFAARSPKKIQGENAERLYFIPKAP
jgi:hypothetical protein